MNALGGPIVSKAPLPNRFQQKNRGGSRRPNQELQRENSKGYAVSGLAFASFPLA